MQDSPSSITRASNTAPAVTVLGLGPMGTAIARTLLRAGRNVTVYNRTPAKSQTLAAEGAHAAPSIADALHASPLVILCVANYDAARALLDSPAAKTALRDRLIVHLSTGMPREARDLAAALHAAGAAYLDGAILVTPSQLGTPDSALLIGGQEEFYRAAEPTLRLIATHIDHVSEDPGAAAALDLAFLSHFFGGLLGFYHGARIMESEHLPVAKLGEMIQTAAPALGAILHADAQRIAANAFDSPESSLANSATVAELIRTHALDRNLNLHFPDFATHLFRTALAAGHAHRDVAALLLILRSPASGSLTPSPASGFASKAPSTRPLAPN
jgi:3-hydroxyisobutyrate dehydrogenase and related beta-hydroxyacid dehydrogenases